MKKGFYRYLILLIVFSVLSIALFGGVYYAISNNYLNSKSANSLVSMTKSMGVDIDLKVREDFEEIKSLVTMPEDNAEISISDSLKSDIKRILRIDSNIQTGYFDDSNHIVIDGSNYILKDEYMYEGYTYYLSDVAFYPISRIVKDGKFEDKTQYTVFRFNDAIIYFPTSEYLGSEFVSSSNIPECEYMIFESNGRIVFQTKGLNNGSTIYYDYIEPYNFMYDYDSLAEKFKNKESSFELIHFGEERSFFVFTPVLDSYTENVFIGYVFTYTNIQNSNDYLVKTLAILLLAVALIILFLFGIFGYNVYKSEQDLTFTDSSFFIKPFSIRITKHGKILRKSRSTFRYIKDFKQYKNVLDFEIREYPGDLLSAIRKRQAFTAKYQNKKDDSDMYVRWIPLMAFSRFLLIGSDVTESEHEKVLNERQALYNQVTNLPNLNSLKKDVNEFTHERYFLENEHAMAAVDITNFAEINKIYSFTGANEVLVQMSHIIDKTTYDAGIKEYSIYNVRTSYFIVVMRNLADPGIVTKWARNVIENLSSPIGLSNDLTTQVIPKVSFFVMTPDLKTNASPDKLVLCLEKAMDRAKRSKLSQIVVYNQELENASSKEQIMEKDIVEGINNNEFVMYFQPQYSVSKKKIIGFESLLRWDNPKYKNESPEHYVTLAERNGLMVELGKYINKKVFNYARLLTGTGISLSLNVSPVQLLQGGFVSELLKEFDNNHLQKGQVAIEITETFLMENREMMITKLRLLRDKGFEIHLDDFGIGYSSMLYLKELPVNSIKIDKEFTKYMVSDKTTRVIVSKIVSIGTSLDLDIICEGVENEKQSDMLFKMGADIMQGYMISKPVSMDKALDLIKQYNGISLDMSKLDEKPEKEKQIKPDMSQKEKEHQEAKERSASFTDTTEDADPTKILDELRKEKENSGKQSESDNKKEE